MQKRRRFKHTTSLRERLSEFIASARQQADGTLDGRARNELLKKIQKAENASNIEGWANSPGLQPPK
jgi:hypothetical protein